MMPEGRADFVGRNVGRGCPGAGPVTHFNCDQYLFQHKWLVIIPVVSEATEYKRERGRTSKRERERLKEKRKLYKNKEKKSKRKPTTQQLNIS